MLVQLVCLHLFGIVLALGDPQLNSKGRDFIIGIPQHIPYIDERYAADASDLGPELLISTDYDLGTQVTVTTPIFEDTFKVQTWVHADRGARVSLPSGIRTGKSYLNAVLEPKGVRVSALHNVSVRVVNRQVRSQETFLALPVDALGVEYQIVTWAGRPQFLVVAAEDNTTVAIEFPRSAEQNINFTYNLEQYRGGDTLRIKLDKYWTFSMFQGKLGVGTPSKGEGTNNTFISYDLPLDSADFTGTRILANKPVAVISGNEKTQVVDEQGALNHLVEQLYPLKNWGREFFSFSTPFRDVGDVLKVVSSSYHTTIYIDPPLPDGVAEVFFLYARQFMNFSTEPGVCYHITSTKPILVAVFTRSGTSQNETLRGCATMSLLTPAALYDEGYSWMTPALVSDERMTERHFSVNLITVIVDLDLVNGLRLDGYQVYWDVQVISNSSGNLSVLTTTVAPGHHTLTQSLYPSSFYAVATGLVNTTEMPDFPWFGYAFPLGLRMSKINDPKCEARGLKVGLHDGIDNDCDGRKDEEWPDGRDDDGDGEIDEDLGPPPVDGNWSPWKNESCSATCGNSTRSVYRLCNNPPPQSGGHNCEGPGRKAGIPCDVMPCPHPWIVTFGAVDFANRALPDFVYVLLGLIPAVVLLAVLVIFLKRKFKKPSRSEVPPRQWLAFCQPNTHEYDGSAQDVKFKDYMSFIPSQAELKEMNKDIESPTVQNTPLPSTTTTPQGGEPILKRTEQRKRSRSRGPVPVEDVEATLKAKKKKKKKAKHLSFEKRIVYISSDGSEVYTSETSGD